MLRRLWLPLVLIFILIGSAFSAAPLGNWQSLGPTNVTDAISSLVYKPDDGKVLMALSQEGALWRSTDGGANWTIPDTAPQVATTPIRFDPNDPNTVYVGGQGTLYKSVDGGASWTYQYLYSSDLSYYTELGISKANSSHFYVPTYEGVMRSLDAGANWQFLGVPGAIQDCDSLALRSDTATDFLFVHCGNTLYRNTDAAGSGTWEVVLTESGMGSTLVAMAPSNQDIVYVLSAESDFTKPYYGGLHALYRSTNGGAANSFTPLARGSNANKLNANLLSDVFAATAVECGTASSNTFRGTGYRKLLAVDPVDPNRVWVGSSQLFRSDDGGANFGLAGFGDTGVSTYLPTSTRAIAFHPQYDGTSNITMVVGTSKGNYRTTNARQSTAIGATATCNPNNSNISWSAFNNGLNNAYLTVGVYLPTGNYLATSSLGFATTDDSSGGIWTALNKSLYPIEIATTEQDPNLLLVTAFKTSQFDPGIYRSTDGGSHFEEVTGQITGLSYPAAVAIDPTNKQIMYAGSTALWRSLDGGTTWMKASADVSDSSYNISAIAVSPSNPDHLLIGSATGDIASLTAAHTSNSYTPLNFTIVSGCRQVNSIVFPLSTDDAVAYSACDSSYNTLASGVAKTTDGGLTWTRVPSGSYGFGGASSIIVDPQQSTNLYIGTPHGVWFSTNSGGSWQRDSAFPNVYVQTLAFRNIGSARSLVAFTGGRGAFKLALQNPVPTITSLLPATVAAGGSSFQLTITGTGLSSTTAVTWNGSPRTITQVTATGVVVTIPASDISSAGSASVGVQNPAPGGGSASATFAVTSTSNAVPSITSLSPSSVLVNTPGLLLLVYGTNFVGNSTVKWNGSDRPTLYVSATQLTAALSAADLAIPGNVSVTVSNPAPGGGLSNAATFAVQPYPAPVIKSVSPSSVQAGTAATITITGSNFLPVTSVRWDGALHYATLTGASTLKLDLSPQDTVLPGEHTIAVSNPSPEGGTATATVLGFLKTTVKVNDILYDPGTKKIYATIPGSVGSGGNSIARIDPYSGRIEASYYVGSEPKYIAETSDNFFLYVSLDRENAYVKFNLATQTVGPKVWVGKSIGAIAVVPGQDDQVLLALNGGAPNNSIVLYDNGVPLPSVYTSFNENYQLTFANPTHAFVKTSYAGVTRLALNGTGVVADGDITTLDQYTYRLRSYGNKVYTERGDIIDADSLQATRPMGLLGYSSVVPEAQRISYLGADTQSYQNIQIAVFDSTTFNQLGTISIPNAYPYGGQLIRWGNNGFAFTDADYNLHLLRSSLVGSAGFNTVDLKASATAFQSNANIGDTIGFRFAASNLSGNTADGVLVGLTFTPNVIVGTVTPTKGTCGAPQASNSGTSVLCAAGALTNGETVSFDVSATASNSGTVLVSAIANSQQPDSNLSDNAAQAQLTVAAGTPLNPVPVITSVYNQAIQAGSPDTTLTINGQNFLSTSTVYWNGSPRDITSFSSFQLMVVIPAADLATMTSATLQVMNPAPGGGLSNSVPVSVYKYIALNLNDIAYDAYRGVLYALVSSYESSASKNSFVVIDPASGNVTNTIAVASDPSNLQITEDGLYAYFSGNNRTQIQQIDLNTLAITNTITLPSGASCGGHYVGYLKPLPGQSTSLLVNRTTGCSANDFVVYDNSTPRTLVAAGGGYQYGVAFDSTGTDFLAQSAKFRVGALGVMQVALSQEYFGGPLQFAGEFVYGSDGRRIDPETLRMTGWFAPKDQNIPYYASSGTVDAALGKAFYYAGTLRSFDLKTLTQIDDIPMTPVSGHITRWGDDGLATVGAIMRSPLVQSGTPVHRAPLLRSISPTFAMQNGSTFTLTVTGAQFVPGATVRWNDTTLSTTYQSATQLTASVPSTMLAIAGRTRVTVFNPAPGGTTSNIAWFMVKSTAPGNLSLTPNAAPNGAPDFQLLVSATNVTPDSIVLWNGVPRATTYTKDGKLKITVSTADLDTPKSVNITVQDGAWDNAQSQPAVFQVIPSPLISITPPSLYFGIQRLGTVGTSQNVTVTNIGTSPLHIAQVGAMGDYIVTNQCPASLAISAICTLAISFAPVSPNYNPDAILLVTSDAANPVPKITLGGTPGMAKAQFSQSSVSFPGTLVSGTSANNYASFTNQGNLPLTIKKVSVTGDFRIVSNPCPTTLQMYYGCAIQLAFTPHKAGPISGSLIVESDDMQNPVLTLPLSGTGITFSLTPSRPGRPTRGQPISTTVQLAPGTSEGVPFDITSSAPFADEVNISCAGLPATVSCTAAPSSLHFTAAGTQTVMVTFTAAPEQSRQAPSGFVWATLLLPLGALVTIGRRRGQTILLLVLCAALLASISCGTPAPFTNQTASSTGSSSDTPTSPTPNESPTVISYNVTVIAQAGAVRQSAELTLQVSEKKQ